MTIAPAPPFADDPAELGAPIGALGALMLPDHPAPSVAPATPLPDDTALTLSVLAALLAAPGHPHPAGLPAAPVRAALSGPLGHLRTADDQGWRLAGAPRSLPAAQPQPSTEPRGQVTAAVLAALLAAAADGDRKQGGWRLPERG